MESLSANRWVKSMYKLHSQKTLLMASWYLPNKIIWKVFNLWDKLMVDSMKNPHCIQYPPTLSSVGFHIPSW